MLSMIGKRLMFAIPSLIGVVIVTFLLTRALPGDPAAYFAGPAATKEAVEQIRVQLGLDKPLYIQFGRYVSDLARGDLGNSLTTGQPVGHEIKTRLPASAERCYDPGPALAHHPLDPRPGGGLDPRRALAHLPRPPRVPQGGDAGARLRDHRYVLGSGDRLQRFHGLDLLV